MLDSTIEFLSVLLCISPYLPDDALEDTAFSPLNNKMTPMMTPRNKPQMLKVPKRTTCSFTLLPCAQAKIKSIKLVNVRKSIVKKQMLDGVNDFSKDKDACSLGDSLCRTLYSKSPKGIAKSNEMERRMTTNISKMFIIGSFK